MTSPRPTGGTYEGRSSSQPRIAGSSEITSVRPANCPSAGAAAGSSVNSQSVGCTSPWGRAARRIWRLVSVKVRTLDDASRKIDIVLIMRLCDLKRVRPPFGRDVGRAGVVVAVAFEDGARGADECRAGARAVRGGSRVGDSSGISRS